MFSLVPIGLARRDSSVVMTGGMPSIIHNKLPTWSCVIAIHTPRLSVLCTFPFHFVQKLQSIWNYTLQYSFTKETEKIFLS